MKKLVESMEFQLATPNNSSIVIDNMMNEWGDVPYAELSLILAHLRFLSQAHQNNHWIASGDSFYGDHELFQRLYDNTNDEIDSVAEKAIGLGAPENVDFQRLMSQTMKIVQQQSSIPNSNDIVQTSLQVEKQFLTVVDACAKSLEAKGQFSRSLENLIAAIEDTHETHVYILKQRVGQ